MNIELNTKLKDLKLSKEILDFWNISLIGKYTQHYDGYSAFSRSDKMLKLEKLIDSNCRIFEMFKKISDFYKNEEYDFKHNYIEDKSFLSIKMLDLLSKEGVEITNVLLENQSVDPGNSGGWRYTEFIELYLNYLNHKNQIIPGSLKNQFLLEIEQEKRYSSYHDVDRDVETYFNFLKVMNPKEITHDFFHKNLDIICVIINDDTRELINYRKNLNFDSQKKIFEYVLVNFPENLSKYTEYFNDLLPSPVFTAKRLYQGCVDINLYKILHENGLGEKNKQHITSVIKECLNVVSSSEFMKLIEQDIKVSNLDIRENNSKLRLNFSTESYEELERFEKILLNSIAGVIKVADKIKIRWTESFNGEDELITNMDAKFINKQYLHETLRETLQNNQNKNKRHKI